MIRSQAASRSRLSLRSNAKAKDADEPLDDELLFKMSKKIAQLTKVIFHLNTENEDNEARVASLRDLYEDEIDCVVLDAKGRLQLRDVDVAKAEALEQQLCLLHAAELVRLQAGTEDTLRTLRAKHEEMMQQARNRQEVLVNEADSKTKVIQSELAAQIRDSQQLAVKLSDTTKQFDTVNTELQLQHGKFTSLQGMIEQLEKTNELTIDKLNKEKKRDTLNHQQDLDKIHKMYQEKLLKQEATLRTLFEEEKLRVCGEITNDINVRNRAENERHVEIQTALELRCNQAEQLLSTYSEELKESRGIQIDQAMKISQGQETCIHLEEKIKESHAVLDKTVIEHKIQLEKMEQNMKETLNNNKNDFDNRLQAQISEVNAKNRKMLQINETRLLEEQERCKWEDRCQHLQTQLTEQGHQAAQWKASLDRSNQQAQLLQEKIEELKTNIVELDSRHEHDLGMMKFQHAGEMRQALDHLHETANHKSVINTETWKAKLNDTENELQVKHAQAMLTLKTSFETMLKQKEAEFKHQLLKTENHLAEVEAKYAELSRKTTADLALVKISEEQLQSSIAQLKYDYEQRLQEKENANLSQAQKENQLHTQLEQIEISTPARNEQLIAEFKARTQQEIQAYISTADLQKQEIEQVCSNLQSHISNLQRDMSHMASEKAKLERELESTVQHSARAKDLLTTQSKQALDIQIEILKKTHDQEMLMLRLQLQDTHSRTVSVEEERHKIEIQQILNQLQSLEQTMESQQSQHLSDTQQLENRLETTRTELQQLEKRYTEQEISLGATAALLEECKNQVKAKQTEIDNLQKEIAQIKLDNATSIEVARRRAEEDTTERLQQQYERALLEIRQQHEYTSQQSQNKLQESHQQVIQDLKNTLQLELSALEQKHQIETETRMEELTTIKEGAKKQEIYIKENLSRINELEMTLKESQLQLTQKIFMFEEERAQHMQKVQQLKQEFEHEIARQIDSLHAEHMEESQKMLADFDEAQQYLKGEITSLTTQLKEADVKYINREAREVDIQQLAELEEDIRRKQTRIAKLNEELNHYRLEIQSREDSLNRMFNVRPNVGLLNPASSLQKKNNTASSTSRSVPNMLPPLNYTAGSSSRLDTKQTSRVASSRRPSSEQRVIY